MIINMQNRLIDSRQRETFDKIIKKYRNGKISIDGFRFYLEVSTNMDALEINTFIDYMSSPTRYTSLESNIEEDKKVSIVIPIYNGEYLIVDTINSILMQSYKNFEIILVDDCSKDNTEKVIQDNYSSYQNIIYVKNEENLDVGKSRLRGYKLSKGDYVVFIDQDDYYIDQDFFLKSINIFNKYQDISFVACDTLLYSEQTKHIRVHELNLPYNVDRDSYFMKLQLSGYQKPTSTFPVMYKKSNLEILELENIGYIGDSTIYQRALLLGQPYILDDIVGVYKKHENNSTKTVNANFIIDTLNSHILTKELAIRDYGYDKHIMQDWIDKKAEVSIGWFLNTRNISAINASQLLEYIKVNNININLNIKNKLLIATK